MSPSGPLFKLQKALAGVRYPSQKHELLEHARNRGTDELVVQLLRLLPEKAYASPVELSVEVARQLAYLRRLQ